jgi:CelD/BcsL family acetyltransferase involved in cellulose biosynthesis
MQHPEWMLSWWDAFRSPSCAAMLLGVENDSQLIGIAPFFVHNSWGFGRVVRFLGSGSACSDFQTLLAVDGGERVVADAVAHYFAAGSARGSWDLMELDGIDEKCPSVKFLLDGLAAHKTIKQVSSRENTWRLDLTDGWEGFCKNLSKSQRSQTRNLVNRFEKNESLRLQIINDPTQLKLATQTCILLHQRRWNAVGAPGCFSDSRFARFIPNALQALAGRGQSEILILEQAGKAVASQIVLKDDAENLFVYQSGRDPQYDSQRVGQILTLLSIRYACERGAQFIDYLRGDEIYKQRLKAIPSSCQRIRVFASGTIPSLRHSVWKVGRSIKSTATELGAWFSQRRSETDEVPSPPSPLEA